MADEKELWTRLVLKNGVETWTKQPVAAVTDAIQRRHPIRVENDEYLHPDAITRFYSWDRWKEKEAEWDRILAQYKAEEAASTERARAKFASRKRWYHRLLGT